MCRSRVNREAALACADPLTHAVPSGGSGRAALEGKGPQRRAQKRLDKRLEEVTKAVGGGYCRLQMPLRLALAVRGTVAGHRLGALEEGGGGYPPFPGVTVGTGIIFDTLRICSFC